MDSTRKVSTSFSTNGTIVNYFLPDVLSTNDYYSFHSTMPGRSHNANAYRYGASNGQEKDNDIFSGAYTAEFWEYDSRTGRRWNVDPVVKFYETPYSVYSNNPIWLSDQLGADTSKAEKGNSNVMIFVLESEGELDFESMKNNSEGWDVFFVSNIEDVDELMKKEYGDRKEFVENLVIKSHGWTGRGPMLDNSDQGGATNNPNEIAAFGYIKSLLTNNANVLFTACGIVQGFDNSASKTHSISKETIKNYSKYFLENSNRNLFLNYTKSVSVRYNDINKDNMISKGENYKFNFNDNIVKTQWAGFIWLTYSNNKPILKTPDFYQIIITTGNWYSDGGINYSKIKAIEKSDLKISSTLINGK